MKSIVVGVDGTERNLRALAWAARRAHRESARLVLITIVKPAAKRTVGVDDEVVAEAAKEVLAKAKAHVDERYPELEVETIVRQGNIVDKLVEAANEHDMIVVGSHHGRTVVETFSGVTGLRVSVSATVPTVVVPSDWDDDATPEGILVGVGPDDVSEGAIAFGVREALRTNQTLTLASVWGLPAVLSKPAEGMGGGLAPVGLEFQRNLDQRARTLMDDNEGLEVKAISYEASSPAAGLIELCQDQAMLVMGKHSRSALGRALFGSVRHGVLMNLAVPTVIAPQL